MSLAKGTSVVTSVSVYRGIASIDLDGRPFARLSAQAIKHFPLSEGDEVDAAAYLDRVCAWQQGPAWEYAISLLAGSAKTQKQMEESLRRKGVAEPVIQAVIERLSEKRLLDDRAYAQRMAELNAHGQMGIYALKQKMRGKGLSEDDAQAALAQISDEDQARAALDTARKLARRYDGEAPRDARRKLAQALARRGFSWEHVEAAVDAALAREDEDEF